MPIFWKKGKMLLLITGIVLVLVILGAAAFFANRNIEQPETESDLFSYTDSPLIIPGEESTLIYNGKNKPETIKGSYASSAFSMDKKKWAILVDQDKRGSGTLYYYDGSAAKKLSDDVSVFTISADGSGVAYLTNLSHDQIGILQLYDASMDTSRVVSSCAAPYMILSPDGKSIAYNSDLHLGVHGTSLPGSTAYISVNGRPGDPMEPNEVVIGLSNNAEYVYYLKYEAVSFCISIPLYVDSSGTHKLGSVIMNAPIAFNQDLSEILYVDDSGKTYLSKVAGDKEKVTDIFLDHMCVPCNSQMIGLSNDTETFNIRMYNVKHLTGHSYLYHDSEDLKVGYLDQKLRFSKTNAITGILDRQIQWTADGKGLYYPDDTGRLQYLQDVSDPDAKPMEVESDHFAKSFIVTPDQSTIYFIDKTDYIKSSPK